MEEMFKASCFLLIVSCLFAAPGLRADVVVAKDDAAAAAKAMPFDPTGIPLTVDPNVERIRKRAEAMKRADEVFGNRVPNSVSDESGGSVSR